MLRTMFGAATVLLATTAILAAGCGASTQAAEGTRTVTVSEPAEPTTVTMTEGVTEKVTVTEPVTVMVTEKVRVKPKPKAVIPGDGVFLVGEDVKPGTYRTAGPGPGSFGSCYWARLSGTSGTLDDIIANGNPAGPTTVTISPSDAAFETISCNEWHLR